MLEIRYLYNKNLLLLCFFWILPGIITAKIIKIKPKLSIITSFSQDDTPNFLMLLSKSEFFKDCQIILTANAAAQNVDYLIREFLKKYSNVTYIYNQKKTSHAALLNQAVDQAKAEYCMAINPQDTLDLKTIEQQINKLESNPHIDLIYSDFHVCNKPHTPLESGCTWYTTFVPEFNGQLLYYNFISPHCIWRKELHKKYGYFNELFDYFAQWEFYNRIVSCGAFFAKVSGNSGQNYINFPSTKKIFLTESDYSNANAEYDYIKKTYGYLWQMKFRIAPEKSFVIITASYNNKEWYKKNLDSILYQNYSNYRIIYIDDASNDDTGNLVQAYVNQLGKSDKITIIKNDVRKGALANIYDSVHTCKPDDIILIVDGDDWLANAQVLTYLNLIYQEKAVWMTYGQFAWFPNGSIGFCRVVPEEIIQKNAYRNYYWVSSHLRTFYAKLFHLIDKRDLLFENQFFPAACDLAMMLPLLEMAGVHGFFLPEVLYIYNIANDLNIHKIHKNKQQDFATIIGKQSRYQPLQKLFN